jgi:hypothetical protein
VIQIVEVLNALAFHKEVVDGADLWNAARYCFLLATRRRKPAVS